jgi:mycofactocin precursor
MSEDVAVADHAADHADEVATRQAPDAEVTAADVLVEEVSIDGMCGLY